MKILRVIGKRFDGHKTQLGGLGLFCLGILYGLPLLIPDIAQITGTEGDLEKSIASFTGAFGLLGLGGKAEKLKRAVENEALTDAVRKVKKESEKK